MTERSPLTIQIEVAANLAEAGFTEALFNLSASDAFRGLPAYKKMLCAEHFLKSLEDDATPFVVVED